LRRKNLISAFPYQTQTGWTYDSGDYAAAMAKCQALADWKGYAGRQAASAAVGRWRGRSIVYYTDNTGIFNELWQPHDHRRNLRARWRTPRPAIARCRGRDHNVMTTVTALLHHPPTGRYRSRRRTPVAPVPAKADAMPPIPAEAHRRMQQRRPILDDGRQSTPAIEFR
jgi:hypothetical protein